MSKKQASKELFQYMSAPDMYRMAAGTSRLGAVNPRASKYLKAKSRSMFRGGRKKAEEARGLLNQAIQRYKQGIRETVLRKTAVQKIQQKLAKYRDQQQALSDMLTSVRFQGDVLAKSIDKMRYTMQQQSINNNKRNKYASVSQSLQQQKNLLKRQQQIERYQRMLARGIGKGENMLKKVQQDTLASIQRGAESEALLQMAKELGLPLNQKTLKGYILAEIQAALLQTKGKTSS
jgi:hypothetical protein